MKRNSHLAAALLLLAVPLSAQSFAIGPKISTLGYGADAIIGAGPVNLRLGGQVGTYEPEITSTDIEYDSELDFQNYNAILDFFPARGSFHVSAGAIFNDNEFRAQSTEETVVVVNDIPYRVSDVGVITGDVAFDDVAPYVGFGWGNPLRRGGRWGVMFDLGVALTGEPEVTLVATPNSGQTLPPGFLADLAAEEEELERELEDYKIHPVVSLGVYFRF